MTRRKNTVLILYTLPRTARQGGFAESEAGVLEEVGAVTAALQRFRIPCRSVGVKELADVPVVLSGADERVVFNLVEGFWVRPHEFNYVPAVARAMGKACTGNDTPGMILSLHKGQAKALLEAAGLPCPKGIQVDPGQRVRSAGLFAGPYIVKPCSADASEGIHSASLVPRAGRRLDAAVRRIHESLHQPALVESFVDGREINVSVLWRRGQPHVLPPAEIEFRDYGKGRPRIVGYEAKWLRDSFEYDHTVRVVPAPLAKSAAHEVRRLAVEACRVLGCLDYCRVDFRLDRRGSPTILEVNANPDLAPDAGFAAALHAGGIRYEQFIRLTVENALARAPRKPKVRAQPARRAGGNRAIRWTQEGDREAVVGLLVGTQFFRPDEVTIAKEVLDEAIQGGPAGHYQSFVIETEGRVAGWVCWGPTPCTIGSFDVYWIAVRKDCQGQGLGAELMGFAERQIAAQGGRLAVVETSGREAYEPTRAFYERLGYGQAARIAGFYGPGDDKVVFTKTLP
ncbi:MAG: GNAT family N-acetyltransferase [Phycisphaerae bacterium]|nr:GNAT family N-acetyltransferase [Phycisphaerae bacterium]